MSSVRLLCEPYSCDVSSWQLRIGGADEPGETVHPKQRVANLFPGISVVPMVLGLCRALLGLASARVFPELRFCCIPTSQREQTLKLTSQTCRISAYRVPPGDRTAPGRRRGPTARD